MKLQGLHGGFIIYLFDPWVYETFLQMFRGGGGAYFCIQSNLSITAISGTSHKWSLQTCGAHRGGGGLIDRLNPIHNITRGYKKVEFIYRWSLYAGGAYSRFVCILIDQYIHALLMIDLAPPFTRDILFGYLGYYYFQHGQYF